MIDLETTQASELKEKKEEEKHTLMEELHRTRSNSSSSSDEEVEGGERKKKKKGLKEKIKEDASVPVEKCDDIGNAEAPQPEEKKGFLRRSKRNYVVSTRRPKRELKSLHQSLEQMGIRL